MESKRLKNHKQEHQTFTSRAVLAFFVVMFFFAALGWRYYYLQVEQYDRFAAMSDRNRVQFQPVAPTRGLLYDRNGVLLADNRPSYSLTLLKEEVKDVGQTLEWVGELISLSERDIERFYHRLKQRRRPFETVPIRFRLTEDEIATLAVNYYRLPGIQVEADLIRYYPYGEQLVHAMGYVGRVNERELHSLDAENYAGTHYIGKLGIEKFYEEQLHGQVGFQKVETNARGRVMRVLERTDPIPGSDLVLSLDLRLQQITEYLLGDRKAAVVAIDPSDGSILAMVSTPGYDPNLFVTGISNTDYKALRESKDLPLFNRALRGRYPPGSTLKPMIAIAALDSETVTPNYKVFDPGWYSLTPDGRKYRDWKRGGHGMVDLNHALAQSCDVWFYNVGHKMGVDNMSNYLGKFGFGQITSIDLPEALAAILPSREWKKRRTKLPWYTGDSINLSIGQGYMVATPLQLATATAVIANRGRWIQPKMVKGQRVEQADGSIEIQPVDRLDYRAPLPDIQLKSEAYWDAVIDGMIEVVHGVRGTARKVGLDAPYRIAGKTGTAQVVGIKQDEEYDAEALSEKNRDHALFVSFAPVEEPKIALAVIVENGGGGSSTAAPIARQIMDAYLTGYDPRQSAGDVQ